MRNISLSILICLILTGLVGACTVPGPETAESDLVATWVAATLSEIASSASLPSATPNPPANPTASSTPIPEDTPATISTPQNPLVLETTLCWKGPGAQYEVVSALKKDERVALLGQGSIAGWWIVDNPIYHDPCWAQAKTLQIEPGYLTYALPIYTPPPSPTPTPRDTATPTITNTP